MTTSVCEMRETKETRVKVVIDPGAVPSDDCRTGLPFFDHMLSSLAFHGGFALQVRAEGDVAVDPHHLVEDVGITLGRVVRRIWRESENFARFGSAFVPMDEALVAAHLDLSGRPFLAFDLEMSPRTLGDFHSDLVLEFFRALVNNADVTLHLKTETTGNTHHVVEAAYKAVGRALAEALQPSRPNKVPSTKGRLGEE